MTQWAVEDVERNAVVGNPIVLNSEMNGSIKGSMLESMPDIDVY